jgi:hypothetical protein
MSRLADLLVAELPMWSRMWVTGVPISVDRAREVIRRTDRFLLSGSGGNDEAWKADLARRLGMPHYSALSARVRLRDWDDHERRTARWLEAWGAVRTQYVFNAWLSCAEVGGPRGWCRPDGAIEFTDHVGKSPSVRGVLEDWVAIARAFPFLELAATLMSQDRSRRAPRPIVTCLVSAGQATLAAGGLGHHREHPAPTKFFDRRAMDAWLELRLEEREHGVPASWIRGWERLARSRRLG